MTIRLSHLIGFLLPTCLALLPARRSHQRLSTGISSNFSQENAEWYVRHWDHLLQEEHSAAVADLRERRSRWNRRKLESTGVSLIGVSAEPDSELYGEKIVRIYREGTGTNTRLRDLYTRGDVLMMTPQDVGPRRFGGASFRGRKIIRKKTSSVVPKEVCVMDVGSDWLTASVGPSWPAGLWESRKLAGLYEVRLDRTVPKATLLAQKKALDSLRRGEAGEAASALVNTFFLNATSAEAVANQVPSRLQSAQSVDESVSNAIKEAKQTVSNFGPNTSQEEAIAWALKRRLSLIRGPPGTGKTLCAAHLISSAIRLIPDDRTQPPPRVLAVAHSNGAADVLLQALLQLGVPAVRVGRPASVSTDLRHRTIVAMSERHPDVTELRRKAMDPSLESHVRGIAAQEVVRCLAEVRRMIATTASVVVASCIGAHQLLEKGNSFSSVVLDEAAQSTEPALMCALAAAKAEQIVFVGDTRQLPPTVASDTKELRDSLGVSPMARLESCGVGQKTLKVQYRMSPALLQFPSRHFYNGLVTCADEIMTNPKAPPLGFPWPNSQPIAFLSVGANLETTHDMGGKSNPTEAELVVRVVLDLLRAQDLMGSNIAVISPYAKQVQLLRTLLASRNIRDVNVGTVDSFQGQETDLVVFSAVRSNSISEIGFLRDPRRLCVALTRARRGLILIGDPKVLQTSRHWQALLESCSDRACVMEARDLDQESRESNLTSVVQPGLNEDRSDEALVAAMKASLTLSDALDDLLST